MLKLRELSVFKRKIFWTVSGVFFLLCLLCAVRLLQENREYFFEGQHVFQEGTAEEQAVLFEHIALPAGVYSVRLRYESGTDMLNQCGVSDGTVFYGGLLCNGEELFQGMDQTDFLFWLFEGTRELQVWVRYSGTGELTTADLTVVETDQLWIRCLVSLGALYLLWLLGYLWILFDRTFGIPRYRKNVVFFVTLTALIAAIPYLLNGNIFGADLVYHMHRIEGVKDGILSGQIPVRLEPEWIQGYGYASGVFYCDLFLLFPALLRLAGFTVMESYNAYGIAVCFATAWIAYFCFGRIFRRWEIGTACSALYTLSIFRIYKMIITAAIGEGTAFAFLPLVLYGFYRVFTENPKASSYRSAWLPLAVGYAGLIQTHVLTCEITAFLTVILCLVFIRKIFVWETFRELAKGALAAVGLSLWHLVPFLDYYLTQDVHIKHVYMRTIQDRGLLLPQLAFHFWKHGSNALGGDTGMQYSHALGVGLVLVIGFLIYLILWFGGRLRSVQAGEGRILTGFSKAAFCFGGMLMLMSLSVFPWDRIQALGRVAASLVSSIQFPNRFLGWATVFLVSLFGYLLWYFRWRGQKTCLYLCALTALLGVTTSSMYLLDYVCRDHALITVYNEEGKGSGYISGAEYLIEGTREEELMYRAPVTGGNVSYSDYTKNYLQADMVCTNTGKEEGYVELPMLYYKGYRAFGGEERTPLQVVSGENHVVRVVIPPEFQGQVRVGFYSPLYWRLSELLSLATLGILTASAVMRRKGRAAWGRK